MIQKVFVIVLFAVLTLHPVGIPDVYANDIRVEGTRLIPAEEGSPAFIQFDISWDNSWRLPFSSGVNNWDAAWVFIKYREVGNTSAAWSHLYLSNTPGDYETGTWTGEGPGGAVIDPGLVDPRVDGSGNLVTAYSPAVEGNPAGQNPVVGAFVFRENVGRGRFKVSEMAFAFDPDENGMDKRKLYDFKVFAIEMVYVPQGAFFVGSGGSESGSFTDGSWTSGATIPLSISSEDALTIGQSAGNLWGTSSSGDNTIGGSGTLPAAYPKGFAAFYMMKYSITQQQYVDFLNTLTRAQQNNRTATNLAAGVTSVTNRYVMTSSNSTASRNGIRVDASIHTSNPITFYCDLNGNGTGGEADDGQWIAMNWINWVDGAAYMDWSGLRPMTELEYEKAARGFAAPVPNEYAWGSTSITAATGISNAGANNETASNAGANAVFDNSGTDGPVRVGAFAKLGTTREQAGASYWGIMELSGNLWERPVTVGNVPGRGFTGLHGDGALSANGHANVTAWPGLSVGEVTDATGSGWRGGSQGYFATHLRVSHRFAAVRKDLLRRDITGFRGVRSAGCINNAAAPTFDTSGGRSPNQAIAGQLLTYKVTGTGSHLWIVPNDWTIITGQGTNEITVLSGETLPGTVRVAAVNSCGAGAEETLTVTIAP